MAALSLGGGSSRVLISTPSPPLVLGRAPWNSESYTEQVFKVNRAKREGSASLSRGSVGRPAIPLMSTPILTLYTS